MKWGTYEFCYNCQYQSEKVRRKYCTIPINTPFPAFCEAEGVDELRRLKYRGLRSIYEEGKGSAEHDNN